MNTSICLSGGIFPNSRCRLTGTEPLSGINLLYIFLALSEMVVLIYRTQPFHLIRARKTAPCAP